MDQTQQPEAETDVGQIVQQAARVITKSGWKILLMGLATLSASVVVLSFMPNRYTSEATILIVEQQIPQNLIAPLSTDTVSQKLDAMEHEVLSRTRLLQIIEETGLFVKEKKLSPDAAVGLMRKSIAIEPLNVQPGPGNSFSAFSISFSAETPEAAQEVTRRLSSLFIERNSEAQAHKATTTTIFLKEQLQEKQKKAAELDGNIRAFKMRYAGNLPEDRAANQTRVDSARSQLQETLASLDRARGQRAIWQSMLSGNLNASLTRLKSERKVLLYRFTPQHPDVVKKDEEIAQLEALLAQVTAGGAMTEKQLNRLSSADPTVAQLEGQLEANRLEIESLTKDEKRLQTAITEVQGHLNLTPALEDQLAGMTRELDALNLDIAGVEKMQQPSELAADMERQQEGQQFRQLDPATLPTKPTSPARLKISLGSLFGGIALGLVIAFLPELQHPTFHTESELRQRFSPPLVITVPLLATQAEKRRRNWKAVFQWAACGVVTVGMAAVEYYVYKHP